MNIINQESWAVRLKSFVVITDSSNTNTNTNTNSNSNRISVKDDVITIDREGKKNTWRYDGVITGNKKIDNYKNLYQCIHNPVVELLNLGFNATILINDNECRYKQSENTVSTTLMPILKDLYANDVNENINTETNNIQILSRNITLSCYELYNDIAYDLLDPGHQSSLKLRTHQLKDSYETHVDGLKRVDCVTINDIIASIDHCLDQRLHLVSTIVDNNNETVNFMSPISHFFISINIDQTTYDNSDNVIRRRFARLSVVALGSSDGLSYRCNSSKETINIPRFIDILNGNYNTTSILLSSLKKDETLVEKQARMCQGLQNGLQSLSTLQRVVKLLNENVTQDKSNNLQDSEVLKDFKHINKHIPYRDSILTRILQSSLQGNCCLYLLTIANRHGNGMVNSLRFAYQMCHLYTRVRANDHLLGIIQSKKSITCKDIGNDDSNATIAAHQIEDINKSESSIENGQFKAVLKDFVSDLSLLSSELDRLEINRENYLKRMGMSLATRREIVIVTNKATDFIEENSSSSNDSNFSNGDDGETYLLSSEHGNFEGASTTADVNTNLSTTASTKSRITSVRKSSIGRSSIQSSDDSMKAPSLVRGLRGGHGVQQLKMSAPTTASSSSTMTSLLSSTTKGVIKSSSSQSSLSPRTIGTPIPSSSSVVSLSLSPSMKKVDTSASPLSSSSSVSKRLTSLLPAVKVNPINSNSSSKSSSSSPNKLNDKKNDINTTSDSPFKKMVSLLPVRSLNNVSIKASNIAVACSTNTELKATSFTSDDSCSNISIYDKCNTVDEDVMDEGSDTNTTSSNTTSRERINSISTDYGNHIKNAVAKNTRLFSDSHINEDGIDISGSYDSIPSINSTNSNTTADINSTSNNGASNNESMSKHSVRKTGNPSSQKKKKEIYYMSNRRSLIEEDDDGDDLTKDEKMFLRYVSSNQIFNAEKMLIAGINVHLKNNFERDAIQIASRNGCNAMIEMLLRFNANISSRGLKGDTLFHLAAANGFVETLKLLHLCGILPEAVDCLGQTVVHVASRRGEIKVLEYLHDELGFTYKDFLQEDFDGRNSYDVIPRRGYNQDDLDLCREYVNMVLQQDPKFKAIKEGQSSLLKLPSIGFNKANVSGFTLNDLEKRYTLKSLG